MNDAQTKEICLALMRADTEDEVVRILSDAGYWNMQAYWRYYGDRETNFNSAGNQQAKPDSALIEKIINSVDARLMNECLVQGIDPAGNAAPQSIRAAVAAYFEDAATADKPHAGQMKYWPPDKRTQIARGITLAATGSKPPGKPSTQAKVKHRKRCRILCSRWTSRTSCASRSCRANSIWEGPECSSSAGGETCN